MKINKLFLIITSTFLFGQITSQNTNDLNLSGTVTGNSNYKAYNKVESSQVISSGKTTYLASNQIVLQPGFEVKSGAEFEITMNPVNDITILTYNICVWCKQNNKFTKHAEVITESGADVVAIQELEGKSNFATLKTQTGLEGTVCNTDGVNWLTGGFVDDYGIALLWNQRVGIPTITKRKIKSSKNDPDYQRAYIIAEFVDFCFVATHYSLDANDRIIMTNAILNETVIQNCIATGKPIYIAGDLNEQPYQSALIAFTNNGFTILNDYSNPDHQTTPGQYIDLIFEYNTNPNHFVIERGIHTSPHTNLFIPYKTDDYRLSDHKPYRVKVKIK